MPKQKPQINAFRRGDKGFFAERVETISEIDDGVFLYKYGGEYFSMDARTGIDIGGGVKTRKEALELYGRLKPKYLQVKKSPQYKKYVILNKKNRFGEWTPQSHEFPSLTERRYKRWGKGEPFERESAIIKPKHTEASIQESLRVAAEESAQHPTIRKVYGKGGDVAKVVNYERRGSIVSKTSLFRTGKTPKGTKLIGKFFLKQHESPSRAKAKGKIK